VKISFSARRKNKKMAWFQLVLLWSKKVSILEILESISTQKESFQKQTHYQKCSYCLELASGIG